jgi:hypothetical protein
MFFDLGFDLLTWQFYRGTCVSSFERSRDFVVPVQVSSVTVIQKDFCTLCMTIVNGSLLPAEVSKGVPPNLVLRSWHNAKLEGWDPFASFTGHLDDDRWVGVQQARIRKIHFFRRKRETIHEHFVVNKKSCHLSVLCVNPLSCMYRRV